MKNYFGTDGKIVTFTPGNAGINHQVSKGKNIYLFSIASMLSDNKHMYQELAGVSVPQFVSTWNTELTDATASASKTIVLPMTAGPEVDWGDGTINNLNTHVYAAGGIKTITIDDTNTDFRFNNAGDKTKIIEVSQCNGLNITNRDVFRRCNNLEWLATDAPNITTLNLANTFEGCVLLNGTSNFAGWDVSSVTSLSNMFFGCSIFTGGGIENWDVGSCKNFNQMFFAAHAFNVPIGVWNMSSATNIGGMFRSSNGFNQDIDDWDVSNVKTMNHVFAGANSFAYGLPSWDVGNVVTCHAMFSSKYNGDITTWTFTSAIKDLSWMFAGNTTFNQDISGWNVASVTSMANMFNSASAFDQDLTGWNIGNVTNMSTMLNNCGMSQANYDAFLIMCEGQSVQSGLALGATGLTYTSAGAGGTARANLLTVPQLWTITGDTGA